MVEFWHVEYLQTLRAIQGRQDPQVDYEAKTHGTGVAFKAAGLRSGVAKHASVVSVQMLETDMHFRGNIMALEQAAQDIYKGTHTHGHVCSGALMIA